ncbi:MAG: O-antigen ligase family protein [Candidatus Omnitrophota bacterium]|jgi:O-antigen ligase
MLALLLTLIFIRPFISSVAFPSLNYLYLCTLLAALAGWIILRGISGDKIKHLALLILLLVVSLIISFGFSLNKPLSAYELSYYSTGLLFLAIIPSLSITERQGVIRCILFSGLVVSLLAIYQYFFGFTHLTHYASSYNITNTFVLDYLRRRRVFFPFVTPNVLAGFLIMIIPLTLMSKKYILCLLPLGAALILTQSLGAILSLFLAFVFYFYMLGKNKKRNLLTLAGILLVMVITLFVRFFSHGAHTHPTFSTLMRLRYWQDTLFVICKYPIIGTGLGNFNLTYSRFTHNSYLQFWAETGIVSLAAIIWLVATITKKGIARAKSIAPEAINLALLTANITFLLHNLIDFTFFLPEVSLIWWIILGLLI